MTRNRTAALRKMVGQRVHIHFPRGDMRVATGNLLGPLDMIAEARGLWGAITGVDGRPTVYAFDPADPEIVVQLAA